MFLAASLYNLRICTTWLSLHMVHIMPPAGLLWCGTEARYTGISHEPLDCALGYELRPLTARHGRQARWHKLVPFEGIFRSNVRPIRPDQAD